MIELNKMRENNVLLYMLTFPGSKAYIGITNNLEKRLSQHKENRATAVSNAIRKYGVFETKVLVISDRETAYLMEKRAIEVFDTRSPNGYNIMEGGVGGHMTEETKRKIGDSNSGRIPSKEVRQKMSESHMGVKRGPHSPEHRKRISESQKGKVASAETRRRQSEARIGKKFGPLSEEHKRKLSKSRKGKKFGPLSKQHRENISKAAMGRVSVRHGSRGPPSEETKQKISTGLKDYWARRKASA